MLNLLSFSKLFHLLQVKVLLDTAVFTFSQIVELAKDSDSQTLTHISVSGEFTNKGAQVPALGNEVLWQAWSWVLANSDFVSTGNLTFPHSQIDKRRKGHGSWRGQRIWNLKTCGWNPALLISKCVALGEFPYVFEFSVSLS
jgi:hypothetical protein